MMLAVVLYHSCMFFTGSWFDSVTPIYEAKYLSGLARWLNTFHVQSFTMASGYLFYCLRTEKGKYNNFRKDIVKRGKRLLVPYFCVMITWAIPFDIYYGNFSFSKMMNNYILGCAPSQLWFLPMLFLLFVVFYRFLNEKHISTKGMIAVAVISLGGGHLFDRIGTNFFQISTAIKYAGYYYLGAYLYSRTIENNWIMPITGFGSIAFFLLGKMIKENPTVSIVVRLIGTALRYICPYMGVIFIYCIVKKITEKSNRHKKFKIWCKLKENSFGIYLFHQQIIYLTIIPLNGKVSPIVQVMISFVCAVGVSGLMTTILKRFKLTQKLYGL